jgi:hypothetical protein
MKDLTKLEAVELFEKIIGLCNIDKANINAVKLDFSNTDSKGLLEMHDWLVTEVSPKMRYYIIKALRGLPQNYSDVRKFVYYSFVEASTDSVHGPKQAFKLVLSEVYNDRTDEAEEHRDKIFYDVQKYINIADEVYKGIENEL